MTTYANCPVCQNINGAGLGDCPGHDNDPQLVEDYQPDHDCTIPTVCGLTDPFSAMAGMSGPDHVIRCANAPDPNVVSCQCGGNTPMDQSPSACQWCGVRF